MKIYFSESAIYINLSDFRLLNKILFDIIPIYFWNVQTIRQMYFKTRFMFLLKGYIKF